MENIRTALVTGADRGLGLALTKALLAQGYKVWAGQYGHECQDLQELKAEYATRLHSIRLDISDAESVSEALRTVAAETEKLDLLMNNGAILGNTTSTIQDELDFDDIEQVFRVNTLGALRMTNSFIDLILKSSDKLLVNISSEAGSVGACNRTAWYAYCMSKAALNMQSQLIHNQIAPQGGKVLVVHPGHVQSYMKGQLDATAKLSPEQSAHHILGLIEQRLALDWTDQKLALIDYQGETWPW